MVNMAKTQKSFEDKLNMLEDIISKLENGDAPLEECISLYEKGITLSKDCIKILDEAEQKVKIISDKEKNNGDVSEEQ